MNIKKILLAAALASICLAGNAQKNAKPALKFRNDGEFKILQFTDLHIIPSNPTMGLVWENLRSAITSEKPDLVMLTGDQIFATPGLGNYKVLLDTLDKFKVPYALVFGNHDRECGNSDAELLKEAMSRKMCIAGDTPGINGNGNYYLPVHSAKADSTAAIIWCFDSGDHSPMSGEAFSDYDYVHSDQIEWYAKKSKEITAAHGGKPLPSIAFMHIPLPEYAYAFKEEDHLQCYGIHREAVSSSHFNSGLFCKMLEMGDIMAVYCGHEHDNDFSVIYYGIMLAYGRYGGAGTVYNNLGLNGCRVIVLKEGQRTIDNVIRLRDGSFKDHTVYPKDYVR